MGACGVAGVSRNVRTREFAGRPPGTRNFESKFQFKRVTFLSNALQL